MIRAVKRRTVVMERDVLRHFEVVGFLVLIESTGTGISFFGIELRRRVVPRRTRISFVGARRRRMKGVVATRRWPLEGRGVDGMAAEGGRTSTGTAAIEDLNERVGRNVVSGIVLGYIRWIDGAARVR
jgi:hypothetical protein